MFTSSVVWLNLFCLAFEEHSLHLPNFLRWYFQCSLSFCLVYFLRVACRWGFVWHYFGFYLNMKYNIEFSLHHIYLEDPCILARFSHHILLSWSCLFFLPFLVLFWVEFLNSTFPFQLIQSNSILFSDCP